MKTVKKLTALLLCLCLAVSGAVLFARADEKEDPEAYREGSIIVSLGDSYASGEGIDSFYGGNKSMADRCTDEDWLAHRSVYSWGGQLRVPGTDGTMADNKGSKWFFAASSGAETEQIRRTGSSVVDKKTGRKEGQQTKEYDRDGYAGTYNLPGQLDVFYNNPDLDRSKVDYVTLSIGGNDVGFEEIIKTAATGLSHKSATYDAINDRLEHFYDPGSTYDKLKGAYRRVAEAAPNATIIVTGYPPLLAPDGGSSYLFGELEADAINTGVHAFNNNILSLINDCKKEGIKIEFVSVEEAFRGHEAYSSDPWINPIITGSESQDLKENRFAKINQYTSPYSIHPNRWGAEAYARCVQNKIDEIEAKKAQLRGGAQISGKQNVVLVLDNSGSMEGSPIRETRSAAKNFVDSILQQDAGVGVVTFESTAVMRSVFTRNADALKSVIDGIYPANMTNTEAGLRLAAGMLSATGAAKKIIVLMSDGLANVGLTGADLDAYIQSLKNQGIYVYTMGFFQGLSGSDLSDGQSMMENAASPGYHYEVEDADHLVDFFGDVADQIKGQKYAYARIACPVDVEVTYGGETLSSVTGVTRTDFGTLTFEAGEGDGSDNRTKILRLKEDGRDYQILIRGNGRGTMTYTAGYMDENGEYTDLREIRDVPITEKTRITVNASREEATVLDLDSDGDGRVDKTYEAGGPGPGCWWIWLLAGLVTAGGAVLFLVLRKKRGTARPAPVPYPAASLPYTAAPAVSQHPAAGPRCSSCGAPLTAGAGFCTACGAPVQAAPPAARYCTCCGKPLAENARFCVNCGAKV